jgi:hypothetical protein
MATGYVLAGWILIGGALTGLGLGLIRLYRRGELSSKVLLLAPWAGLALAGGVLQILHFWLPIGPPVAIALLLAGWAGLVLRTRALGRWIRSAWASGRIAMVLAGVCLLFLAHRATGQLGGDSGLYHIQVVRWNQAYPVVTGLGNLHDRYAFNNSSLLIFAALDHGPGQGRSNHLLNSLLIGLVLLRGIAGICRLPDPSAGKRAIGAYDACGLVFALQMTNHSMVSSYSTDVMPAGMCFVAGSLLLGHLIAARPRGLRLGDLLICLLLLAAAVTAKLTAAMFSLCAGLICLLLLWKLRPGKASNRLARLAGAAAIGIAFVAPWLVRSVLLSGYLAYPSGVGRFDLDWRIPSRIQQNHMEYIRTYEPWNRNLGSLQAWGELADRLQRDILFPAALAGSGLGLLGLLAWAGKARPRAFPPGGWLLAGAAIAGIGLWLKVSPQRRMGFYLFWILEGVVAACLAAGLHRPRGKQFAVLAAIIAVAAVANVKKYFHAPGPDFGLHPSPVVPMQPYTTRSGLELLIPVEGGEVFDGPILSTGFPKPKLELRRPGDISAGFRNREKADPSR